MAVYFIQAGEYGPVKIGTAENALSRMAELQIGNHETLRLLRTVDGGSPEEGWLHERFSHCRLRGEWFWFDDEMLTVEPAPPSLPANDGSAESEFRLAIEAFLERTGMTPSLFGVEAMGDPMFVFDLRAGRECRRATREKAANWMINHPNGVFKRTGDAA